MTKMTTTPIFGRYPLKIFFSGTSGPMAVKLGCSIGDIIVCSYNDQIDQIRKNADTYDFMERFEAFGLKIGIYSCLYKYMIRISCKAESLA